MHFRTIRAARTVADQAHKAAGQVRKGSGAAYITHCAGVARRIRDVGGELPAVLAAYLHDTLEDTALTKEEITRLFGSETAALVEQVSEISRPEDGNRATRKAIDRDHYASGSKWAQSIKLADIDDNLSDVTTLPPSFVPVYLREKADLVNALTRGSAALQGMAMNTIAAHRPDDQDNALPARWHSNA
jgi:(p)ppGpp synthase/HD superfamily hydrolase